MGRRVSFSATTKVKEFEPTNLGGTVWNSTYEASEHSIKTVDSTAAAMDMTCAAPSDPFSALFAATDFKDAAAGTEEDGNNVTTKMDMTCSVSKSTAKSHTFEDSKGELTHTGANADALGMDMTCSAPQDPYAALIKANLQDKDEDGNNVTTKMDMTCAVSQCTTKSHAFDDSKVELTHNGANADAPGMDMTCAAPQDPYAALIKANLQDKEEKFSNVTAKMDMTCAVNKSCLKTSKDDRGLDFTCNEAKQRLLETTVGMDMTCKVQETRSVDLTCNEVTTGMELTCKVSKELKITSTKTSAVTDFPESPDPSGMEMTCKAPRVQEREAPETDDHQTTAGIESTCRTSPDVAMNVTTASQVPQVVVSAPSDLDMDRGEEEVTAGMELTCKVPNQPKPDKSPEDSPTEPTTGGMELTGKVPEMPLLTDKPPRRIAEDRADQTTAGIESTCRKSPDVAMNVTTASQVLQIVVPAPSDLEMDRGEEDVTTGMELTCKVPNQPKPDETPEDSPTEPTGKAPEIPLLADDPPRRIKEDRADQKTSEVTDSSPPEPKGNAAKMTPSKEKRDVEPTMEVQLKLPEVTPIKASCADVKFVEDADTMAFNYSMMSSTKIMNSTAFSLVHGDDSSSLCKTPLQKQISLLKEDKPFPSPLRSPVVSHPRSQAQLRLDHLIGQLKTAPLGQPVNLGHSEEARGRSLLEGIEGMVKGIELRPVPTFKPPPIDAEEVRAATKRKANEEEAAAEDVPKKKKVEEPKKIERLSAFQYLYDQHRRTSPLDYFDRHQGKWELVEHHGNHAVVAFMQGTLRLHVVLGHRLQSEEKGSVLVQHATIQSLEFRGSRACRGNDVRLAHHLFLMSITPSKLSELCPNTRYLEKTLRYLMLKAHEASMLVVDLDRMALSHAYFRISDDFKITVKFYSVKAGFTFKIGVDYKGGFSASRERGIDYERGPSHNHLMSKETVQAIFNKTAVGWKHLSRFVDKVDAYIAQLEKEL